MFALNPFKAASPATRRTNSDSAQARASHGTSPHGSNNSAGLPAALLINEVTYISKTSFLFSFDEYSICVSSSKMCNNNKPVNSDYDLNQSIQGNTGLRQGLASYGDAHFSLFLRKVFIKALGYSDDALSRPIVGVVNTYSSFNPCHANVPQLIEAVKRGVQLAGGLAIDFPTISLHESFSSPTSMYLRNLMSMDTEEMIRAQPCDAVVLIGGEFGTST